MHRARLPLKLVALLLLCAPLSAVGQTPHARTQSFGSVSVDTRGLAASVGPHFAARIQDIATPIVRRTFADRIGGSGPDLVLRIDELSLGPITGEKGGGIDHVRGAALVIANHRVLASYPFRGAPGSDAGTWTLPDVADQQRLIGVVRFFAGWARRYMDD